MPAKRIALVVNPCSGKRRGLAILDQVTPIFSASGFELDVRWTEHAGHAREIARTLPLDDYENLCVIGGDGTMHEIVSGLLERGASASIPLGIIPGGTGNDVARHLGFTSPKEAALSVVRGRAVPLDVIRVEAGGQIDYCVTIFGWVGVADVNSTAERLRMLGPPRYALAALWQILFARKCRAAVILDDRYLEDDFQLVAVCNTIFSGSGMRLAPRAKVDDGKMDVVIVRRASRRQMLHLFRRVFDGSHVHMPFVEYYQVRSMKILTDDRRPLDIDGEIRGTPPVSGEVLPGAVRIYL